jgi:hypothetical protein
VSAYLVSSWQPAPGQRVADLAAIAQLADQLGRGLPAPDRAAAARVLQRVGGELADREHELGGAGAGQRSRLGMCGDEAADAAQVCVEAEEVGVRWRPRWPG